MTGPTFSHHSPGTVSGDGERIKGVFDIGEPYKYFTFLGQLSQPVPAFQAPHALLNYDDIIKVAKAVFGSDARVGPHDIYIPFVDNRGEIVGTVTGKLSSHVAETPVGGTVALSLS
ncbi:hypothetical protein APHAL10511_003540 [Amanita phalloides]|nr:hypothetical protein APHAL10511_003540 [Amanita phalloides]